MGPTPSTDAMVFGIAVEPQSIHFGNSNWKHRFYPLRITDFEFKGMKITSLTSFRMRNSYKTRLH